MKRHSFVFPSLSAAVAVALLGSAILVISCAGSPGKQRMERTVTVQVPVLTKETSFYADGLVDEYSTYRYDADLRVLLEKTTWDAARPDPVERTVTETEAGRVKAETSYGPDGKQRSRKETTWNRAGLVAEERILDQKGAPLSSSSYLYDGAGMRLEWKAFDSSGNLSAVTTYNYDNGRLVNIAMRDGSGNRTGSIVVEYDADGLPSKRSYLATDGSLQKFEVLVHTDGKLTALETRRADGSLVSLMSYRLGELGQLLEAITTDSSGAIKDKRSYEYGIRQEQKTEVFWQ